MEIEITKRDFLTVYGCPRLLILICTYAVTLRYYLRVISIRQAILEINCTWHTNLLSSASTIRVYIHHSSDLYASLYILCTYIYTHCIMMKLRTFRYFSSSIFESGQINFKHTPSALLIYYRPCPN